MKPFNLEEFKKNPSRKIVTRSGDPVQILRTTAKSTHPIVALIKYPLEYEEVKREYDYLVNYGVKIVNTEIINNPS